MIRIFCDACREEIKDNTENGSFKIQEKTFAFIKHQKQDQVRVSEYIFCIDCSKKIRDFFSTIKEEKDGGNTK
jgi:hypothetical protein